MSSRSGFAESLQDTLRWHRGAVAIASLAYSLVVFAVCAATFYAHGVNDDWALCNALSGRWGDPQGITLFLNALLCQCIEWLNVNVGVVNWFFVLEYATGFVAFFLAVYVSLTNFRLPYAGLLIGAYTLLMIPGCALKSNFTFVAAGACCVGLLMLLVSLGRDRHSPPLVLGGLALVFVGILWRANIFLVAIPLFGVAALLQLGKDAAGGKERFAFGLPRLWPFVAALALLAGSLAYHGAIWSDSSLDDWYQYNEVRSAFSDYPRKSYDEAAESLAALGVSKTDYEMLENWITEDPEFFTEELIRDVNDTVIKSNDITFSMVAYTSARYAYRLVKDIPLACFIVLSLFCTVLFTRGRTRLFCLCTMALACILGIAMLVVGRLPDRVNYPLWMYTFSCIGCLAGTERVQAAAKERPATGSKGWAACCLATALLCLATPLVASVSDLSQAIPRLNTQKVQAVVAVDDFEAKSPLLEYIEEHPQAVVVVNTGTNFDIVYANLMTAPASTQAVQRTIGLGGWATRSPYANERNVRANMANPIKGLVENENAVYVASSEKTVKLLQAYLREHYYPHATYERIGRLPSWNGESELLLFAFGRGD